MKKIIIIGAGISGLSTAWFLRDKANKADIKIDLKILEKEGRAGGKIWSIKERGYLCEWGPNGFLDSKPQTLNLCESLGIASNLHRSNDNARKRFIYSEGILHRLPEGASSFLKSKLISWRGKLRLAMEPTPFIKGAPDGVDETLADFGRRRLGSEALDKLIAPMVSGIFAGDPETMSLISCFPRIAELEREYGGLIKAMMMLAKKKKKDIADGKVVSSAAGPGGVLTSFREGIQVLADTLAKSLEENLHYGIDIKNIKRSPDGVYLIKSDSGEEYEADIVISASPAYAIAEMVQTLDTKLSELLGQIRYASMTVVCFGYEKNKIDYPLDGFGYLIPKKEGRNSLGTLWDSSMFENRAPKEHVLLRSMMGGACFPEYIKLSDEQVQERVMKDLETVMGIKEPPSFIQIFRHPQAIPQYTVGHADRLNQIDDSLKNTPNLILTGNSYRGIGINDCVSAAEVAAEKAFNRIK